jgi:O-antigen/teichoic acid export membrane protein
LFLVSSFYRKIKEIINKNSFWAILDQGIISLSSILILVIIGRNAGKSILGYYSLGMSIVFISQNILHSFLLSPFMRFAPGSSQRKRYNGSILIHSIGLTLFIILFIFIGIIFMIKYNSDKYLISTLFFVGISITFLLFREFVRHFLYTDMKFRESFLIDSLIFFFQFSFIGSLVFSNKLSAGLTFICQAGGVFLIIPFWFLFNRFRFSFSIKSIKTDLLKNIRFGTWVAGSNISSVLSVQLQPWIIRHFLSVADSGLYAACHNIIGISNPVRLGIMNYLGPKMVHTMESEGLKGLKRDVIKYSFYLISFIIPIILLICIFGDNILQILYNKSFSNIAILLVLLAISRGITLCVAIFARFFWVIELLHINLINNTINLVLLISLSCVLIKNQGLFGVGLANIIVRTFIILIYIYLYKNISRLFCKKKTIHNTQTSH